MADRRMEVMVRNRSLPAGRILPYLYYQNVVTALDWLTAAFGFTEHYRYGDPVSGAQLHLGGAWIMLSVVRPGRATRRKPATKRSP
jgi:uncharacterized glyoxalase superfamily protein PhnB